MIRPLSPGKFSGTEQVTSFDVKVQDVDTNLAIPAKIASTAYDKVEDNNLIMPELSNTVSSVVSENPSMVPNVSTPAFIEVLQFCIDDLISFLFDLMVLCVAPNY